MVRIRGKPSGSVTSKFFYLDNSHQFPGGCLFNVVQSWAPLRAPRSKSTDETRNKSLRSILTSNPKDNTRY
jgi:hypothetical protein